MRSHKKKDHGNRSEEEREMLFESVFKQRQPFIYSLALRATKSRQQAGDIVQEVFLKLWEHRAELDSIDNIDAWLTRVVKNKLIDFLRKAAADDRLRASLWRKIEHLRDGGEQLLESKESDMLIRKAVEELPPQRKAVYFLSRESGLSYQEIATKLSISRHTVKNQLSLAVRFLQKKLSFE